MTKKTNLDETIDNQRATQAPPPAFMKSVINQARRQPKVEPGAERERMLVEASDSDFWKVLKQYIEAKQMMLAQQLRESVAKAGLEEIGFRFLVTDQVNAFAGDIIRFVETPKEILRLQQDENAGFGNGDTPVLESEQ